MPKLIEPVPNWPPQDFKDYYQGTYVISPLSGNPAHVRQVTDDKVHLTAYNQSAEMFHEAVDFSDFKWSHLKYPTVGWVNAKGIPVYTVRKPLREKRKGFCLQKLHLVLPDIIGPIIQELHLSAGLAPHGHNSIMKLFTTFTDDVVGIPIKAFFLDKRTNAPDQAIAAVVDGDSLFEFVSPMCIVLKNLDNTKVAEQHPACVYYGPTMVAYVTKDKSLKQIQDFPLDMAFSYA